MRLAPSAHLSFTPDLTITIPCTGVKSQLNRLQQTQNALAHADVAAPRSSNPDHILRSLHWLEVQECCISSSSLLLHVTCMVSSQCSVLQTRPWSSGLGSFWLACGFLWLASRLYLKMWRLAKTQENERRLTAAYYGLGISYDNTVTTFVLFLCNKRYVGILNNKYIK